MKELKLCPFCGGEAERIAFLDIPLTKEKKGIRYFGCKKCCVVSFVNVTEKEAIKAWNTRYEPPREDSILAPALAPVLRNEKEDTAYRKGRFDERLQQRILKGVE